jgi:hypothetical protein
MRDRHLSRLCRSCGGPMARQEDSCWRCAAAWALEAQLPTTLRLVAPAALTTPGRRIADAAGAARAVAAE